MDLMLRQERRKRGWTLEYVAEEVGLTRQAIQMIETGVAKPSYNVLIKLLDLFDYSDPRKLFGAATPESKENNTQKL